MVPLSSYNWYLMSAIPTRTHWKQPPSTLLLLKLTEHSPQSLFKSTWWEESNDQCVYGQFTDHLLPAGLEWLQLKCTYWTMTSFEKRVCLGIDVFKIIRWVSVCGFAVYEIVQLSNMFAIVNLNRCAGCCIIKLIKEPPPRLHRSAKHLRATASQWSAPGDSVMLWPVAMSWQGGNSFNTRGAGGKQVERRTVRPHRNGTLATRTRYKK